MLNGMALSACFSLLFLAAYYVQFHVLNVFDALPSASLLFLPAGVKLLGMLVGRSWGVVGLFIANDIIEYVFNQLPWGIEPYVIRPLVYLLVPYLTLQWLLREQSIAKGLDNLTPYHVVLIAVMTSFIGSFVFQWYLANIPGARIDVSAAIWSMTIGDVSGIVVTLLLVIGVRRALLPALSRDESTS